MGDRDTLSLSDWNWATLMLTQAMIGGVSPNFRFVELDFDQMKWVVRVTLQDEDETDREEVLDICDQFSVYLIDVRDRISSQAYAEIVPDIVVSQEPIIISPATRARPIFRMRES